MCRTMAPQNWVKHVCNQAGFVWHMHMDAHAHRQVLTHVSCILITDYMQIMLSPLSAAPALPQIGDEVSGQRVCLSWKHHLACSGSQQANISTC